MKRSVLVTLAILLLVADAANSDEYVIAVSRETHKNPQWARVVDALVAKRENATVVTYDEHGLDSLDAL